MTSWSPTKIMSNLASSLTCSLGKLPREEVREQLIRGAILASDPDDNESDDSNRSESPEIPMLDSPSLFRLVPKRDENSDPNAMVTNRRSCRGAALRRKDRKTRPGTPRLLILESA